MAIQFLRGTSSENDSYTGPVGSLTIDTDTWNIRLHDGETAGGTVIANASDIGSSFDSSGDYENLRARATTAGDVGLEAVDNTSDADKPVSTAQQNALDLKAPLNSPTFTGEVTIDQGELS